VNVVDRHRRYVWRFVTILVQPRAAIFLTHVALESGIRGRAGAARWLETGREVGLESRATWGIAVIVKRDFHFADLAIADQQITTVRELIRGVRDEGGDSSEYPGFPLDDHQSFFFV
jgi:hypothetical protein